MMAGKMLIKRMLCSLLASTGLLSLVERSCFANKALVLMYHRVLASPLTQPLFVQAGMYVKDSTFEKQIVFLKKKFEIVFLEELVFKIMNGENIGRHCAITFDDGWRDNYTEAFPILKKHRVPATIFLATGFIGTGKIFWPEALCCYLDRIEKGLFHVSNTSVAMTRFLNDIHPVCRNNRESFFETCIEILKGYSPDERSEIIKYCKSNDNLQQIPRQMMSWDEARQMLSSGVVRFGAHTLNHEILDQVPLRQVQNEILNSRDDIEYHLGCSVKTFAYPNGNHNENICHVLDKNRFTGAVTTQKGFLTTATSRMKIPRVAVHEDVSCTMPMFRSRILFRKL